MSYEISYRRQAFVLPMIQTGHFDDLYFLVEEAGSNNCYEHDNKRRSRRWCCTAAGAQWECMAEVTRCAASCCGGSLVLCGRRRTAPEQYIRAWRNTIAAAAPFADAPLMGFHIQLFAWIPDVAAQTDRKYAFERLSGQTLVPPRRDTDKWSGGPCTEWRFCATESEQVKLWLETKTSGRGYLSVDASGPAR